MRRLLALAAILIAVACGSQTPVPTEAELIAYTKAIDVSKLDPALPSQTLEEWLRVGPARVKVDIWKADISSCGDKPDGEEPPEGFDLCAEVFFHKNGVSEHMIITLGTSRKGIVDPPKFKYAMVGAYPDWEIVHQLSELPHALDNTREGELILYAKRIDVSKLDPTLPSQTLEEWLRVGPAQVDAVRWTADISSCDDKPDGEEPPDGFDLCATVSFRRNGVNGHIIFRLGASRKGIVEPPKFVHALVGAGPAAEYVYKLSDLPRALEKSQEAATPSARKIGTAPQ